MNDWLKFTLSDLGSYASIIGIGITFWTFLRTYFIANEIKEIKRQYLFKKRAAGHLGSIQKCLDEINVQLASDTTDYTEIRKSFVVVVAELESVKSKLIHPKQIKTINNLVNRIGIFRASNIDKVEEKTNPFLSKLFWIRLYWIPSRDCVHYLRDELASVRNTVENISKDTKGGHNG